MSKLVLVIILCNKCKLEVIDEGNSKHSLIHEFNKITKSNTELEDKIKVLLGEVQNGSYTCNQTNLELRKIKDDIYLKALDKDKNIMDLFQKVKEEEITHLKMEDLLHELYSDLDLFAEMYEVLFEDLTLLKDRYGDGTDSLCELLSKDQEFTAGNMEVGVRSMNRDTDHIVLQHRLNLAKVKESELTKTHEELNNKRNNNEKMCDREISHLNEQIKLSKQQFNASTDVVDIIQADLLASTTLTQSFLLEIQAGMKLLSTIKKNIHILRDLTLIFKEDEECYSQVRNLIEF